MFTSIACQNSPTPSKAPFSSCCSRTTFCASQSSRPDAAAVPAAHRPSARAPSRELASRRALCPYRRPHTVPATNWARREGDPLRSHRPHRVLPETTLLPRCIATRRTSRCRESFGHEHSELAPRRTRRMEADLQTLPTPSGTFPRQFFDSRLACDQTSADRC